MNSETMTTETLQINGLIYSGLGLRSAIQTAQGKTTGLVRACLLNNAKAQLNQLLKTLDYAAKSPDHSHERTA